jgi:hypothetical protein
MGIFFASRICVLLWSYSHQTVFCFLASVCLELEYWIRELVLSHSFGKGEKWLVGVGPEYSFISGFSHRRGVEEHEYIYGFIVLVSCSNFKVQRIKVNLMHVIVFGAMTILC